MGSQTGGAMNLKELANHLEMEEEEFLELIDLFLDTSLLDLNHLQSAVEKRENVNAVKAAHSIKGAAANLGMTEIYELAKEIETEARGNQLDRTLEWIPTLRKLLDQVAEGLKQEGWKQ
jgi:HPt (histidine-containing phosphotransfer) domain-containing protein